MKKSINLKLAALLCLALFVSAIGLQAAAKTPNVILIFTDDQGYADLGCYGATDIKTPNIDRMAAEGTKFSNFYVGANFCSPSRAALMTGCYPPRVGFGPGVLRPDAQYGLNPLELTLAEIFKSKGYKTKCVGKWHMGEKAEFLPLKHGFDEYFGALSNFDPWEVVHFPGNKIPLHRNDKVIDRLATPEMLTELYTEEAVEFIKRNNKQPFFIYLPHTMAHRPYGVTEKFTGKSEAGLYGDVAECLDWSTGQIIKTIKDLKLEKNTLVFYLTDNGGHHKRNGALRGGKGTCWEGGFKVPCIAWGPGTVPAGKVADQIASSVDFAPTFAKLLDVKLPRKVDGMDIWDVITGDENGKGHDYFHYFHGVICMGIRDEQWKLHKSIHGDYQLYNLKQDIGEKNNVRQQHPQVFKRLKAAMLDYEHELNQNRRPAGRIK
jgi:arylsulfatase A